MTFDPRAWPHQGARTVRERHGNGACAEVVDVDMSSDMTTDATRYPERHDDAEWRRRLTPQEYAVLRKAATERAFTGEYWDDHTEGIYTCRACGAELFRSDEKFDSHCGWPSFFAPLAKDRVEYIEDRSFGMVRTEVRCANCGSHLGHLFEGEGYDTPTDQRYCINSISLRRVPKA
jgi:peptide-methionine (R)-S-oxide reductase